MRPSGDLEQDAGIVYAWAIHRADSSNSTDLEALVAIARLQSAFGLSVEEAWHLRETRGFHFYGAEVRAAFEAGFRLARGELAGDEEETG